MAQVQSFAPKSWRQRPAHPILYLAPYLKRALTAPVAAAVASSAPISGERVFTTRIMAGVAYVALSIAGFVAVKVVELRLPAAG